MCHWKRAASTSAAAPLMVSMQLTDFSKMLVTSQLSTTWLDNPEVLTIYGYLSRRRHRGTLEACATKTKDNTATPTMTPSLCTAFA
jgi:hypothetical protein